MPGLRRKDIQVHGGTSGWKNWNRIKRGSGGDLWIKSADGIISAEFTPGWGLSWTYTLLFTRLVPKEKYATQTAIWWGRTQCMHMPDARRCTSQTAGGQASYQTHSEPTDRGRKPTTNTSTPGFTLSLTDRPPATHRNWVDCIIREIHISMRLK